MMQRSVSMPQPFRAMGASYAISWQTSLQGVTPQAMYGAHPFLRENRMFVEESGGTCAMEDICAARGPNPCVVVSVCRASPRDFIRKQLAAVTGIATLVFVCRSGRDLLELGFERELGGEELASILTALGMPAEPPLQAPSGSPLCRKPSTSSMASEDGVSTCEGSLEAGSMIASSRSSFSDDAYGADKSAWDPPPQSPDEVPSLGSLYHPGGCKSACKYVWKSQGCKDGAACSRCHLCPFVRRSATSAPDQSQKIPLRAAYTGVSRHSRRRRERQAAMMDLAAAAAPQWSDHC